MSLRCLGLSLIYNCVSGFAAVSPRFSLWASVPQCLRSLCLFLPSVCVSFVLSSLYLHCSLSLPLSRCLFTFLVSLRFSDSASMPLCHSRIFVVSVAPGVLSQLSSHGRCLSLSFLPISGSPRLCLCLPRPHPIPRTLGPHSTRGSMVSPRLELIAFSQNRGFVLK